MLKRYWNILQNIGVTPELSFSQKLRVQLCNQFLAIGLPLSLIYLLFNIFGDNRPQGYLIIFFWLTMLTVTLYLNHLRFYNLVQYILLFSTLAGLGTMHFFYGEQIHYESMYLMLMAIIVYFLGKRWSIGVIILSVQYLVITLYLREYGSYKGVDRSYSFVPTIGYMFFSIFAVTSMIRKILTENRNSNRVIRQQNKILLESNEELKRFNYIVSHDLKEPIRSIVSFSGLLKRNIEKEEQREEFLEYIINSGKQLNTLVEDIRQFQDVDQLFVIDEEVDLSVVLEEVKESMVRVLEKKKAILEWKDMPTLQSSKSALYILLKNLIENGIKYNESEEPRVSLTAQSINNNIHIYVKDNGIGIPEKYFDQVFTMFKRLEATRSKGSGLGLNIAQKTAERLNGELSILHSQPGNGTTFLIKLPQLS